MRTFNKLMILVFGLMAVATLAAGFSNPIHFVYSAMSALMAAIAYAENRSTAKCKSSKILHKSTARTSQ